MRTLEAELLLKKPGVRNRTVTDGKLGIDVSKNTLDASLSSDNKVHAKSFANSSDGWRQAI
jgi:hypothetical protein